jgi:hypothetical protein
LLQFRAQRAAAHSGRELFERALERNAIAQHRRQLLVEKGQLIVTHDQFLISTSSLDRRE